MSKRKATVLIERFKDTHSTKLVYRLKTKLEEPYGSALLTHALLLMDLQKQAKKQGFVAYGTGVVTPTQSIEFKEKVKP